MANAGPCVADRREFGVVDCDEVGSVFRQVWIVGNHDRHRLTYIADMAPGQHRLQVSRKVTGVGTDSHRNRWHADVGAGQDRPHARKLQRVAYVDRTQTACAIGERTTRIQSWPGRSSSSAKWPTPASSLGSSSRRMRLPT